MGDLCRNNVTALVGSFAGMIDGVDMTVDHQEIDAACSGLTVSLFWSLSLASVFTKAYNSASLL